MHKGKHASTQPSASGGRKRGSGRAPSASSARRAISLSKSAQLRRAGDEPAVRLGWATPKGRRTPASPKPETHSPTAGRPTRQPTFPDADVVKSPPGRWVQPVDPAERRRKEALLGVNDAYSTYFDDEPHARRGRMPAASLDTGGPFDYERGGSSPTRSVSRSRSPHRDPPAGGPWPRGGYVPVSPSRTAATPALPAEWDRSVDRRFTSHMAPRRIPRARRHNVTNPILLTEYPPQDLGDRPYGSHVEELSRFLSPREEPPENPTPKSPERGAPLYRSYLRPAEARFERMQPGSLTKRELASTHEAFRSLPAPPPTVRSMKELNAGVAVAPTNAAATMQGLVTFGASELTSALAAGTAAAGSGAGSGAGAGAAHTGVPPPASDAQPPLSPVAVDAPASGSVTWEPSHDLVFDKDNADRPPHASFMFEDGFEYKASPDVMRPKQRRRRKKQPDPKGIVLPWELEAERERERQRRRAEERAAREAEAAAAAAAAAEAARRPKPLMQVYIDTLKPIRLSDQAFTRAVQLTRARKIHMWYARLKAKWEADAYAAKRAAHARAVLELNAAKTIQAAWMRYSHRVYSHLPGVAFSETPSKALNQLGARSRPRFRPSRKAMTLLFPPDARKHTRRKFANMRLRLRECTRAWRAAAATQIHMRKCQDKLLVLGKAFRFYTINRRIHRKRLEYRCANMIQDMWRVKMRRVQVRAGYVILPLIKRHLWYLRRQRLRSLRRGAAEALQRFARRVIARLRERMGAEVIVKRAMIARRARVVARRGRMLLWFKYRIMVRRISNAWFKERAFRARILAWATKRLAAALIRARKRLAERKERIGPVHWELLHLEQIKQGKAAGRIQRVFRGFMGRFRAKIVRMQYNLVRLPLDLAARKIQSGWRFYNVRIRLRKRRKKIARFDRLKFRQQHDKARANKLGAMSIKRYRRVRRHAYPRFRSIWAAKIIQKFYRKTLLRREMMRHANHVFKLKRAVLLLESCALRLQKRWLKHRYPFGLPKYRLRRDEAAELFQSCWRGYKGRQRFKAVLREAQKAEAARVKAAKEATIQRYRRRQAAVKNWWVPFVGAKLLIWGWRAQWSLVFKTEAARQLSLRQFELAMRIQRKWRARVAHRKGVRSNRVALRKMYGKLWKKAKRLKGGAGAVTSLFKTKDLKVGDRVIARFGGGVKEYPAVIVAMHAVEAVEAKNRKTGEMEMKPTTMHNAFKYHLKYADGALETDVDRSWITFDMRPYLTPQEGLYDEDFLFAPKDPPGVATLKKFVKKIQERHQEVGYSSTTQKLTPSMAGKKAASANAAVAGVAIICGEQANANFAQQQLQRRLLLKPHFEKLMPDLRAAQRTGREREDRQAVHVWVLKDTSGPFVTDMRLIFPHTMKQDTPFWNAIVAAGFNVLVRPNMPEADTFPLPVESVELAVPIAIALKVNAVDNPVIDIRPSSLLAGELGPHHGATDTDMFQEGYSPLPEDLAMFKLDARARLWLKWRQRSSEKPLVGVGRRDSFDDPEAGSSEEEDAVLDGVTRRRRIEAREKKRKQFLLQPTRPHLEIVLDDPAAPTVTTEHREAITGPVRPPSARRKGKGRGRGRGKGTDNVALVDSKPPKPSPAAARKVTGHGPSSVAPAAKPGSDEEFDDDGNPVSIGGAFPRRLLHAAAEGTSKSAIEEGRRLVKQAVGAAVPGAGPFSKSQSLLKYGGADVIDMALQLRIEAMERQAKQAEEGDGSGGDSEGGLKLPPVSSAESLTVDTRPDSRGRRSRLRATAKAVTAVGRLRARGSRSPSGRSAASPMSRTRSPLARAASKRGGLTPAAAAPPPEESEEEDTEDSDALSASSSDPSMPEQGEFDDGTEWGKYTTVYEEDFSKMEVIELDGGQTSVVLACRFTDLQISKIAEFFRAVKVLHMIGWRTSLGPLRRELYQLIRIPEDSLLKFKLFIEWLARYLLMSKQDLTRMLFRAFDSSKRGDMTRGDFIYLVEVLHPTLSAPKRTQMVNTAGKLLALKTATLGESFKMKDFLIMNNKFPSLVFPWYQLQVDLQRVLFGEDWWKKARERIQRMPSKPGGTTVPVVYDEFAGK